MPERDGPCPGRYFRKPPNSSDDEAQPRSQHKYSKEKQPAFKKKRQQSTGNEAHLNERMKRYPRHQRKERVFAA